jgi:hypothetical protein
MAISDSFIEIAKRHLGPPVNIEGIVRAMGLNLDKKADLEDSISGQLKRCNDGSFKISANRGENYFRQRFTIAHELGHYLLHAHLIGEGVDDSTAYRSEPSGEFYNENIGVREETQANKFAASLLMPKSVVLTEAVVGAHVSELARKFQVSQQAMRIRLNGLGVTLDNDTVESGGVN